MKKLKKLLLLGSLTPLLLISCGNSNLFYKHNSIYQSIADGAKINEISQEMIEAFYTADQNKPYFDHIQFVNPQRSIDQNISWLRDRQYTKTDAIASLTPLQQSQYNSIQSNEEDQLRFLGDHVANLEETQKSVWERSVGGVSNLIKFFKNTEILQQEIKNVNGDVFNISQLENYIYKTSPHSFILNQTNSLLRELYRYTNPNTIKPLFDKIEETKTDIPQGDIVVYLNEMILYGKTNITTIEPVELNITPLAFLIAELVGKLKLYENVDDTNVKASYSAILDSLVSLELIEKKEIDIAVVSQIWSSWKPINESILYKGFRPDELGGVEKNFVINFLAQRESGTSPIKFLKQVGQNFITTDTTKVQQIDTLLKFYKIDMINLNKIVKNLKNQYELDKLKLERGN